MLLSERQAVHRVVTSRCESLLGAARSPGFVNPSCKSPMASGSEKHCRCATPSISRRRQDEPADAPCRELARPRPVQRRAPPAPPSVTGLSPAEIAFHTAAARRYGFHATLKAPFLLAAERNRSIARRRPRRIRRPRRTRSCIPRLAIGQIDGSSRWCPAAPLPALNRLADDVVKAFDRFRAPLSEAEIERRNPDALSAEEFRNLCQWGYPYVFDAFRFHMTLTGRVGEPEAGARACRPRRGVRFRRSPGRCRSTALRCSSNPKRVRRS